MPSVEERLAVLETDSKWVKGTLARMELNQKEIHKAVERHVLSSSTRPQEIADLVNGNGRGPGTGPTGVNIQVGQKTALAILSGGSLGLVTTLLKVWGVL